MHSVNYAFTGQRHLSRSVPCAIWKRFTDCRPRSAPNRAALFSSRSRSHARCFSKSALDIRETLTPTIRRERRMTFPSGKVPPGIRLYRSSLESTLPREVMSARRSRMYSGIVDSAGCTPSLTRSYTPKSKHRVFTEYPPLKACPCVKYR